MKGNDMTAGMLTVLTSFKRSWLPWVALWLSGTAALVIMVMPSELDQRLKAACDRAFATLMTTKDLVELERSKFLLDKGSCSIQARMGAE